MLFNLFWPGRSSIPLTRPPSCFLLPVVSPSLSLSVPHVPSSFLELPCPPEGQVFFELPTTQPQKSVSCAGVMNGDELKDQDCERTEKAFQFGH